MPPRPGSGCVVKLEYCDSHTDIWILDTSITRTEYDAKLLLSYWLDVSSCSNLSSSSSLLFRL